MDISCPANRVLIIGSYFSVSCRQASRPSLSPARNTMLSAAPSQVMSITQQTCAGAARSLSSRIVAFGIGATAFAASSINFWCSSRATRLAPLRSRLASPANASTPTPVACVPRSGGPRTSCLSAASSFAACCLLCSFCNSVLCLVKPYSKVVNC